VDGSGGVLTDDEDRQPDGTRGGQIEKTGDRRRPKRRSGDPLRPAMGPEVRPKVVGVEGQRRGRFFHFLRKSPKSHVNTSISEFVSRQLSGTMISEVIFGPSVSSLERSPSEGRPSSADFFSPDPFSYPRIAVKLDVVSPPTEPGDIPRDEVGQKGAIGVSIKDVRRASRTL
jgi:hypothetical protein